jgi:hypothetical protein
MKTYSLLLFSALVLLFIACGQEEINSHRPDRAIKIDGSSEEWEELLMAMPEQKLAFGVCNDDSAVYFCLTTTDRSLQMRIMGGGLTVWFGGEGGKKKSIGIRYPVGGPGPRERGQMPPRQELTDEQRENMRQHRMKFQASDVEIVNADNQVLERLPVENNANISAKFDISEQTFVYELKVPLQSAGDVRYAIPASTNQQIGFGMEVTAPKAMNGRRPEGRDGQMERPPDGGGMGGDMGGEGMSGDGMGGDRMGGGGMGSGRMGGGRMGGGRPGGGPGGRGMYEGKATAEPIKVWLKVNLAN